MPAGLVVDTNGLSTPFEWQTPNIVGSSGNAARVAAILDGYSIPFAYSTPADPVTTQEIVVSNLADFNAAISQSGTRVIVRPGDYIGSIGGFASDVNVVADNAAVFSVSGWAIGNRNRIRWTGGVINGSGAVQIYGCNDLLFDNVRMNFNELLSGFGSSHRIAFLNCSIRCTRYCAFSQGSGNTYSDYIIGNCSLEGGYPSGAESTVRFQNMATGIVVGSRLWNGGKHNLRAHYNSGRIFWAGNQIENTGIMSDNHPIGGGVRQCDELHIRDNSIYGAGIQIASPDGSQLGPPIAVIRDNAWYTDFPAQALNVTGGPHGASWDVSHSRQGGQILGPGNTTPTAYFGGADH